MKLEDRTVLISGGATGIGLAFALKFLELGNEVIITGRRLSKLEEAKKRYPQLHIIQSDASDPDEIVSLAKQVERDFPALDVLINNAGIASYRNLTAGTRALEDLQQEVNTNLSGVIRMTASFLDLLKSNKGTVINISSGLALVPMPCMPVYCATKAAIHSYTLSLRFQLEDSPVEVIEIMPPAVKTNLTVKLQNNKAINMISTDELVKLTFRDLQKGKKEILPGQSSQLAFMRRIAPRFIYKQLWKASGFGFVGF